MCFQWTNRWCRALLNTTMSNAKTKVWTVTQCVMISWTSLTCWMTFFWTEVSCLSVWWYHIPFLRDAHWLLPFPVSKVIVRHIYVSFHLTEHEGYILLYIYSAECVEILYLISHSSSPKSAALCTSFYTTKNDCELSVEKLTARVELVFVVFNLNLCILFVQIYTCYPHTHKKS